MSGPSPEYPKAELSEGRQALVLIRAVLGADGRLRDPQVVVSFPSDSGGGRPFIESSIRALLTRRYAPARLDGVPVAVNYHVKLGFRQHGADAILKEDLVREVRGAAAEGDPRSQFIAGAIELTAETPGPPAPARAAAYRKTIEQILSAAQAGIAEAQLFVGRAAIRARVSDKAIPWLERGSASGVPGARTSHALALLLGHRPDLGKARTLLGDAPSADDAPAVRRAITILACSEDPAKRSPELALALAKRLSLGDPDPLTAEAIAAARASAGDPRGAADAQRAALKRADRLGWSRAAMEARLDGYAAGRPCTRDFMPLAVEGL